MTYSKVHRVHDENHACCFVCSRCNTIVVDIKAKQVAEGYSFKVDVKCEGENVARVTLQIKVIMIPNPFFVLCDVCLLSGRHNLCSGCI